MKTLIAFCDLRYCPVSYDFGVWLVRAMAERDAAGCDRLHVVLVPHTEGLGGFARHWGEHDEAATRWRLWHVVMAMVPLAGATVTLTASRAQALEMQSLHPSSSWWPKGRAHLAGPLIDAARAGGKVPRFMATEAARRYVARWFRGESRKVVTLTTRNQATHADRNSAHAAWSALAESLDRRYAIARLHDTHVALGSSSGAWAAIDVDLRMALYERAGMNLIGNNGPATLLWFSGAPFLQFGFGLPEEKWTKHMAEHLHLRPGDQLPWARADQRLVWRPDSFEVMREQFDRSMPPSD